MALAIPHAARHGLHDLRPSGGCGREEDRARVTIVRVAYYSSSLWKPGETLADPHTLALPADLGRPPYAIVVLGLYDNAAGLQLLGEPQPIGTLSR